MSKDHYATLGIAPGASSGVVRDAYHALAKRLHPDRVGARGTKAFQEIVEAYEVLSDARRRGVYDAARARARRAPASPPPRRETAAGAPPLAFEVVLTPAEARAGAVAPLPVWMPCAACGGSLFALLCPVCAGRGAAAQTVVRIRIPPHVPHGAVLAVPLSMPGHGPVRLAVRVLIEGGARC